MRKAARVDENHGEIVDALRQTGWIVQSLAALGKGVPDLLLHQPRTGRIVLAEVKQKRGKLTPDQQQFCGKWPVTVLRSVDDAIQLGKF